MDGKEKRTKFKTSSQAGVQWEENASSTPTAFLILGYTNEWQEPGNPAPGSWRFILHTHYTQSSVKTCNPQPWLKGCTFNFSPVRCCTQVHCHKHLERERESEKRLIGLQWFKTVKALSHLAENRIIIYQKWLSKVINGVDGTEWNCGILCPHECGPKHKSQVAGRHFILFTVGSNLEAERKQNAIMFINQASARDFTP